MPRTQVNRHRANVAAVLALLLALSLGASACGGSSNSTSGNSASASGTSKAAAATAKTGAAAVPLGSVTGPQGAAPKKRAAKFSAATQRAFYRFAQCMREKGVSMPEPNINGPGPVFNPRRIDTRSPQFARATRICREALVAETRGPTK
jgi:hypothetical protein